MGTGWKSKLCSVRNSLENITTLLKQRQMVLDASNVRTSDNAKQVRIITEVLLPVRNKPATWTDATAIAFYGPWLGGENRELIHTRQGNIFTVTGNVRKMHLLPVQFPCCTSAFTRSCGKLLWVRGTVEQYLCALKEWTDRLDLLSLQ